MFVELEHGISIQIFFKFILLVWHKFTIILNYAHRLQDERWREVYAILTANLLFIFEDEHHLASPIVMIIIEDCTVEPADDNQTGMPFSFVLKSKT